MEEENRPQNERNTALPMGISRSFPWIAGLLAIPVAALAVDLYFFLSGNTTLHVPVPVVGLSIIGIGISLVVAVWLRSRNRALVEMASVAARLARSPDQRRGGTLTRESIRLDGPFPIHEDDETGFLAARLNALAMTLQQTVKAAEAERAQLTMILASMDSGVILTDSSGRVLLVNPAAERLLARQADTLLRRTILESLLDHTLAAAVDDAALRGNSASQALVVESNRRHLLVTVSPVGEGFAGAVIVLQDQEEQHRLDSVRRDFIANVSHELRTPLASIRAMAETLQMGAREDPEVAESFLDIIIKESDRLAGLTNDILDLARYESGRLDRQPLDLRDLLSEVESQFRANAAREGLEFRSELEDLPLLQGDRSALRQVFLNLLDNAMKYTSEGFVSLRATAPNGASTPGRNGSGRPPSLPHHRSAANAELIQVEISDSGPGIAAEHLPRIFERFYRVDRARSRDLGGTGLGLSIARHVVESHGGHIEVSSKIGEGTTFTVWLPLR